MGQVLRQENVPPVVKASTTSLTLATTYLGQSTRINIGGQQYAVSSTITLSTATSGFNGIDTGAFAANTLYYVYAVVSAGAAGLVISVTGPNTGPSGFTNQYKYLAKFRTFSGSATIADVNPLFVGSTFHPLGTANNTDLVSYAASIGGAWGTTDQVNAFWKRSGTVMELQIRFRSSSQTAAVGGIGLPTSYTIRNEVLYVNLTTTDGTIVGVFGFQNGVAGNTQVNAIVNTTISSIAFYPSIATNGNGAQAANISSFLNTASSSVSVFAKIPIVEWAGVFTAD